MPKSKYEVTLDSAKAVVKALEALDADQQRQALVTAAQILNIDSSAPIPKPAPAGFAASPAGGAPDRNNLSSITPKDYLRMKRPASDIERISCIAYYLTYARNMPHFKAKEIVELNTEAAQPKLTNPSRTIDNATRRSKFLAAAPNSKKQIAQLGEEIVEALPNPDAVKAILAGQGIRPRRVARVGRKKKKAAK